MGTFISNYDGAIFDLDGVAWLGGKPAPYAPENFAIAVENGMQPMFLTNNASRTPEQVADALEKVGLHTTSNNILTSSMAAVSLAEQHLEPGAKVLAIGSEGLIGPLEKSSFVRVTSADDNPDAVIMGFFPEVGWKDLSEAALAIRKGALFIATNLDATLPQERGFMIGNGSLVAAVVNATGVKPLSAGKPEPAIYDTGVAMLGAHKPFSIGDRLDTDIRGAVAAKIPSLHVLTGVNSARDIMLAVNEERPTFLADDMRALNEPYPDITKNGERWEVEGSWAYVDADGLHTDGLNGTELELNSYRAAVHAVWEAIDSGKLTREQLADKLLNYTIVRKDS